MVRQPNLKTLRARAGPRVQRIILQLLFALARDETDEARMERGKLSGRSARQADRMPSYR
jgi:hypothetical protein